ncbi:MAG: hypothetical protein K2L39_07170, partial [Muribaculaceae bacterium]|nr:hypothetical protein [Muribaculaceae bacterium]
MTRYLRLITCLLLTGLLLASGGDELYAKKKKSSRRTRTTKTRKSRKSKRKKKSAPPLPVVVLGSTGPIDAPEPFVNLTLVNDAPDGLDGRPLALWP